MFDLIKNISTDNNLSWKDKIFITSDIDWASDFVLQFVIELFEKYNAKVTFFATHHTNLLETLNENYEIGIHPNFNFLLNGDFRYGKNYKEVIAYFKKMFPESVSVRSHSMTQSTILLDEFCLQGYKYDANHFIPFYENNCLQPWNYWQKNLIKVPYIWEDDINCMYYKDWNFSSIINYKGIKVLDFHPIHIFLNTENIEKYNEAKPYLNDYKNLKKYINTTSFGTRNFLMNFLQEK